MKKRPGKTKLRPDKWGPHVSEIRGKKGDTDSVSYLGCGLRPAGLARALLGWFESGTGPVSCLSLFLFWFLFFLFPVLFHNFCILKPNDFKPKCKIF
jgi:hypothetical protein